jgi:hypothetical protein
MVAVFMEISVAQMNYKVTTPEQYETSAVRMVARQVA